MNEPENSVTRPSMEEGQSSRLSRRGFLTGSSAALASTGLVTIGAAVHGVSAAPPLQATPDATPEAIATPEAVAEGEAEQLLENLGPPPVAFFTIHEAETVEALTGRILPGTPEDPGAREAGVVDYIDQALAGINLGYTRKTYTDGPFLLVEEDQATVEQTSQQTIYQTVLVATEQAPRYGFQSVLSPQEMYRRGVEFVDAYAQDLHGQNFVDLSPEQQDEILANMEADTTTGFEGPSARGFFTQLRNDTIEGMFSDPMYGGNRDMVGWTLIGYPGAQRFYTPDDMLNQDFARPPQSLAGLLAVEGH